MVPPAQGSRQGGKKEDTPNYKDAQDAKHLLDMIGEKIQDIAHKAALNHINNLKGYLNNVKFSNGETVSSNETCKLDHTHDTTVSWGVVHPCDNRLANLFTEDSASQCSTSRISGNNSDSGSCAPYRKLQLCDYNLEKITDRNTTNTNNLLVDVLLAAKHEGDSLSKYMKENKGPITNSNICTILARSFADIGDIIRGKDLYIGNRKEKEKEKLQNNLKSIFQKIYGELKNTKAKVHYQGDDPDFFKLREDWWNANRQQVWKAMTCSAPDEGEYFRKTCSTGTPTNEKCRCVNLGDVPTYFDYVPQFLRWFEEWAEEFCRIKQLKLEKLEQECRGKNDSGEPRYCSRNGCDCEQTINKIGHLRYGNRCIKCLFGCNRYIDWIKNKQKEFEKQKKKCENEIYNRNQSQSSSISVNDMYYDHFYSELKEKYSSIDKFLNLLNQETKCKNIEKQDIESEIDFNKDSTTFSGSQYCKPCPPCGVEKDNYGNFEPRGENDPKCKDKNLYTHKEHVIPTDITILSSGDGNDDIKKKLDAFCAESNSNRNFSLYEEWKCYYEDDRNEACINEKPLDGNVKKQKSYNNFFYYWVAHMLKDSIHWRTKRLKSCISNGKQTKCKNGCNNDCECFKRWVQQKETEWGKIKEHFKKQNIAAETHCDPGVTLAAVLKLEFYKEKSEENSPEDTQNSLNAEEAEELKHLREIIESEENQGDEADGDGGTCGANGQKTLMDKLIDYEKDEADLCLQTHPEEEKCADKDDDDDDDDHEEEVYVNNPCATPSGSYPSLATKAAHQMHEKAKTQLRNRGGRKALRGDASQGHYNGNGNVKNLNAAETFLSLQYYNSNNVHDTELLDSVIIPPEFLRTMFYTFGDYRDICLGTDMPAKTPDGDLEQAKEKINIAFQKIGSKTTNGKKVLEREGWWKEYGPAIWEGMLCALSYNTKTKEMDKDVRTYLMDTIYKNKDIKDDLEEFASRPPFLRWFTEWGEDFCKQQKKEYKVLLAKCNNCDLDADGKTCNGKCVACKDQCKKYKKWIETWKKHYTSQNEKFQKDKENGMYETEPGSTEENSANNARDYLDKQLQNMICTNGSTYKNCEYTCMDKASSTNTDTMPESLDDEPKEVKEKCNCVPDECSGLSVTGSGIPDGSAFGGGLPPGKCKGLEGPQKKMEPSTSDYINDILKSTIPVGIALALTGKYRGKRYIYLEGDSGTDSGYTDHYSDITSSSESEYEELDINDIYVPGSPKYKTLIEVVLEPSGNKTTASGKNTPSDTQNDIPTSDTPPPITDDEWNTLKHDFISQYLQSEQPKDVPNDYTSGNSSTNTNITTTSRHNVDNNTNTTMSRHNVDQKPFIMFIQDRNLLNGEEYNYNVNMSTNSGNNNLYSGENNVYGGIDPTGDNRGLTSGKHDSYRGIDLINDSLSGDYDIYDEMLKRKENELFGTNHVKHTSTHSVAKPISDDPIHNQLELFHKWLDRHRDMCEKWNNKEELLDKLKEEWNKDNDIDNVQIDNKTLNTDVSIQIHMDDPKPINEFSNMDTILDDLDKPFNEPYYYDMYDDDIYYDVNDHDTSTVDTNAMDVPSKVQIEMDVNTKLVKEKYPIADVWDI
ncbi:hypothetical protein C923_05097 [Plasmodium falciparum UGT5.1]|uniref:Erythrocyte membrane protein 1 n=2 Tax=Plasmodium falciparum TaxID=5833 RepID=W7JRP7_PLAFA|nr:hypothetical protein C923_05097 [Plasmodium falciparum UGT5.1]